MHNVCYYYVLCTPYLPHIILRSLGLKLIGTYNHDNDSMIFANYIVFDAKLKSLVYENYID